METEKIFGKFKLTAGEQHLFSAAGYAFGVKREKEGWLIAKGGLNTGPALQLDYAHADFYQTGRSNTLLVLPALPAKPLVFKGPTINVVPGQKFTFYLKIPLLVQLYYSKELPANLMMELPVTRLSDTWFGDPFSGEPAYVLGDLFYIKPQQADPTPLEAVCPVTIFNNSPGVLNVERLILRVENMTLYNNAGKIVTSLLEIEYKGKEVISTASYHYSKVHHGDKEDVLAKPR